MLKQRVVTALILLAVLLPAMFHARPEPFAALALVLIAAAVWEWGRLNGLTLAASVALAASAAAACGAMWWGGVLDEPHPFVWTCAAVLWVLGGAWLLGRGVQRWPHRPLWLRLSGGWLALVVAWLAVAQARTIGTGFLLSILLLVWVADIAAYFAGRAFGTRLVPRRLAPSISPGKSWEGVLGGLAGVWVLAMVWVWAARHWSWLTPSLYTHLESMSVWALAATPLALVGMSVVGDLVESLVKRSAGAKDSSSLLPGHGGVLDRIDALLPTVPMAMALAVW
jgi:phosphatidate cytidylyltransferase